MTEPVPFNPTWPRYSVRVFPSYRFIPGKNPHPRRGPNGHSYGKPEPTPSVFRPEAWHQSEDYLYGIDLYNYAYWWESHELFEGLWLAVGRHTEQGNFFQALIHFAAANIKDFSGNHRAAGNLLRSGLARLETAQKISMGIDVASLIQTLQQRCAHAQTQAPSIRLAMPVYKNEAG